SDVCSADLNLRTSNPSRIKYPRSELGISSPDNAPPTSAPIPSSSFWARMKSLRSKDAGSLGSCGITHFNSEILSEPCLDFPRLLAQVTAQAVKTSRTSVTQSSCFVHSKGS